jgi:hypothetical protein
VTEKRDLDFMLAIDNETIYEDEVRKPIPFELRSEQHLERSLIKRTAKTLSWEGYDLSCGTYKACSAAAKSGGVNKWFGFRGSDKQCETAITKMTIRDVDPSDYVSKYYAYTTAMFSKKTCY